MGVLHLVVVDGNEERRAVEGEEPLKLMSEGRFGCDYAWNVDFTAYRCMPHRWRPGSDSSYAAWQAGNLDEYEYESEWAPRGCTNCGDQGCGACS